MNDKIISELRELAEEHELSANNNVQSIVAGINDIIDRHQSNPIDPDYAEFKAWRESAAQMSRNAEYYRGLVVEIGEMFGESAYTSDDGSIQQDVLCAKVPELVSAALAPKPEAKTEECSLEAWENEASAFYKVTGYLRPGKDPGIIEDEGYRERRDRAWTIWCAAWVYCDSTRHPASLEPLACLAAKDGFSIKILPPTCILDRWDMSLYKTKKGVYDSHNFREATYAACEQLARTWLEEQEEKK